MVFEILTQWENMIQLHKIKDFQFKTYAIFTHTFHCSTIMKLKALKTSLTTTFNCFFLEYCMEFSKIFPPPLSTSFNYRNQSCTMLIIIWAWVSHSPINMSTNSCFKPFQLNFLTLLSSINSKYLLAYLLLVVNG